MDTAHIKIGERRKVTKDLGRLRLLADLGLSIATPWDLKRGRVVDGENEFDGLVQGGAARLKKLLQVTAITHWGTECRGFS